MPDVAIVGEAVKDRWGDVVSPGAATVIRRPKMWPRESSETADGVLVVGLTIVIPPNRPVPTAADTVLVGVEVDANGQAVPNTGEAYEVVGRPGPYYSGGNGPLKATLVNLRRRA